MRDPPARTCTSRSCAARSREHSVANRTVFSWPGGYHPRVRVALVSPYSYTYPGGVGRHAEALAQELTAQGHEARLLAPYDPDDRLARVLHRGARPEQRPVPDYLIPLGRTFGLPRKVA